MIKKIVTKNNNLTSLTKSVHKKLSIQFNLDGFSFCISDTTENKDIYFKKYTFSEKLSNPENLLLKIKEIFKMDKSLQYDFSSILVIHQNSLSTLVPDSYFKEDNLKSYLKHNIKTLATDYITYDTIKAIHCKNVYIPYVNINNYIFQNFGKFEYEHHSSILIEKLLTVAHKDDKKRIFVNVSKNEFDVVVLKENNLLFYNSFSYTKKEDFIYYILFTAEQLKLNVDNIPLVFIGDINETSEIYKISYKYIRNITFLESDNSIFNSLDYAKHSNFILLGS